MPILTRPMCSSTFTRPFWKPHSLSTFPWQKAAWKWARAIRATDVWVMRSPHVNFSTGSKCRTSTFPNWSAGYHHRVVRKGLLRPSRTPAGTQSSALQILINWRRVKPSTIWLIFKTISSTKLPTQTFDRPGNHYNRGWSTSNPFTAAMC